jgi:hypothetical protein
VRPYRTYLNNRRVMRCGQNVMNARSGAQLISRRLRFVSRRPVCGSSRISPSVPLRSLHAALRPVPHHAMRNRGRGALTRPATTRARVLGHNPKGRGALGAFRRRAPLQYSRYCCTRPPRTASHIASVAHVPIIEIGSDTAIAFVQTTGTKSEIRYLINSRSPRPGCRLLCRQRFFPIARSNPSRNAVCAETRSSRRTRARRTTVPLETDRL